MLVCVEEERWIVIDVRGDDAADANGLLQRDDTVTRDGGGNSVAVETGGLLAEPLEEVGGICGLAAGIGQGFPVLPCDERGNVVGIEYHEVVPFAQQFGTLPAGLGTKVGEGGGGSGDGLFRVLSVEVGAGADQVAGGRVWG